MHERADELKKSLPKTEKGKKGKEEVIEETPPAEVPSETPTTEEKKP
jgi:hypothetical protein